MKNEFARSIRICAVAALTLLAAAGCATSGAGPDSGTTTAANDKAAANERCRSAIADVTRRCDQDSTSSSCNDAKERSRGACIK